MKFTLPLLLLAIAIGAGALLLVQRLGLVEVACCCYLVAVTSWLGYHAVRGIAAAVRNAPGRTWLSRCCRGLVVTPLVTGCQMLYTVARGVGQFLGGLACLVLLIAALVVANGVLTLVVGGALAFLDQITYGAVAWACLLLSTLYFLMLTFISIPCMIAELVALYSNTGTEP